MDAVCIGHSHSACVAEAANAAGETLEVLNFWNLPGALIADQGPLHFSPGLRARLHAPIFSMIGGAVHYDIGLLLHRPPFDFIDPAAEHEPLQPGATLIPYGAVRRIMEARSRPYLAIMDLVRQAVDGPMFQMQSPPVYAGEQVHEDDPGWVTFHGRGHTVAPAPFRRRLWRMQSDIIAGHCAATGIVFVPCPPAAMDADFYLRPGLNGRPAHANAAYGALVLDQIRARLPPPKPGRFLRLWRPFGKTARPPQALDQVPI